MDDTASLDDRRDGDVQLKAGQRAMRLDDDAAYEAFQFCWFALANARPDKPVARLETEERLRQKLAAISVTHGGGGRVLCGPCQVDLSADERVALLERIAETPWTPRAAPHAIRAGELLGASVRRQRHVDRPRPALVLP